MFTFDLESYELMEVSPGFRVSFPAHSATGTASTATVLFELDPGAELPVHTDSAEELLIVVQGSGEARIGDEVGSLEASGRARAAHGAARSAQHGRRGPADPRHVLGLDRRLDVHAAVQDGGPDVW